MERFEGVFHQHHLKAFQKCPQAFFYDHVLGLDKEKISLANLGGRAGHETLEYAHKNANWNVGSLFQFFLDALDAEKNAALDRGLELHGNLDVEKYRQMLTGYASKPWNREAEVIEMETEFYFEIKPSRTTYTFGGRIDQLIRVQTDLLRADFPEVFRDFHKREVVLHRDTKFGRRKNTSAFELALDIQIDTYAYALKHGVFYGDDLAGDEGDHSYFLDIIPDFHCMYYVQDHIPYADDKGTYKKDEAGNHIPCHLVSEPCLVGVKNQPCKGLRTYCTKQSRGPGMYFTTRPEARLNVIPKDLGRICAAIRMGHYPRCLGELCFGYCQFRSVCESEVMHELEAA